MQRESRTTKGTITKFTSDKLFSPTVTSSLIISINHAVSIPTATTQLIPHLGESTPPPCTVPRNGTYYVLQQLPQVDLFLVKVRRLVVTCGSDIITRNDREESKRPVTWRLCGGLSRNAPNAIDPTQFQAKSDLSASDACKGVAGKWSLKVTYTRQDLITFEKTRRRKYSFPILL